LYQSTEITRDNIDDPSQSDDQEYWLGIVRDRVFPLLTRFSFT
jgi:hypothetical protein